MNMSSTHQQMSCAGYEMGSERLLVDLHVKMRCVEQEIWSVWIFSIYFPHSMWIVELHSQYFFSFCVHLPYLSP